MSRIYLNPLKGKKYKAEFSMGSGKHRRRKTHTFDDMDSAKKWLNRLTVESDQGTTFERSNWRFVDYYWHWVQVYKEPVVSPVTMRTYVSSYQHFEKYLGEVKVEQLTRARIQRYLNELGLSHETARKDLMHIRGCMRDALLDGTIARNPAEGELHVVADPNRTKSDDQKFMPIKEYQQIRDFLLSYPHSLRHVNWMALMIISQTALRAGECLALKYNDFDFEHNTIRVDESWDSIDQILKEPKTKHANRIIPIPAQTMTVIHRWITYHRQELFKRGITNPQQFALLNKDGQLPQVRNINASYHQIQKRLGYEPKFSTHTFRHTIASLMLGDSKVSINYVSRYLGHANVGITQRYYVGLLPEQEDIEGDKAVKVISM